jgi:hypothetical protein
MTKKEVKISAENFNQMWLGHKGIVVIFCTGRKRAMIRKAKA